MNRTILVAIMIIILTGACSNTPDETTTTIRTDYSIPTFSIASPTNFQLVGSNYMISGIVSDDSSEGVSVYVRVDNGDYYPATVTGQIWGAFVSLPSYGLHTNYVYAADQAGNTSIALSTVVNCISSAPSIYFSSPASGIITNVRNVLFSGCASIGKFYNVNLIQICANDSGWIDATGTTNWHQLIDLDEGTNFIIARAIADTGKISYTPEITVTVIIPYPVMTVASVTNGATSYDRTLTVSGTASVDLPYSISKVQVSLNGVWSDATGTINWTKNVNLIPGTNTIAVRAISDYGKTNMSEDILVNFKAVCVSTAGSDANDGLSALTPKASLSAGLSTAIANQCKYIFVNGDYTLSSGTSNAGWFISRATNMTISGGWNTNFTSQNDISILNGNSVCAHVICLVRCARMTLTNFVVTRGYTTTANGGGIYIVSSFSNTVHCIVTNNRAYFGGGIYLGCNRNNIYGTVSRNTAEYGGGVCVYSGSNNTIFGTVTYNLAIEYGGGSYVNNSIGSIFSSSSVYRYNHCDNDNSGSGLGGGICVGASGSGHVIQSGAVYSPNYKGSGTTVEDNLYGISAP